MSEPKGSASPAFRSTPMNTLEMIPLAKLRLSEANVRKNDSNLFIEELAANIEAKGLLQNLIVVLVSPWR